MSRTTKLLKTLLIGLAEMTLAIVMVLAFFLVSTGILTISFPKGSGFHDLYGDLVLPRPEGAGLTLRGLVERAPFAAHLTDIHRNVKDRPVDAVAWRTSRKGATIGDQHAVQTFAQSGAVISFADQGELRMNQNSLVVVRQPQRTRDFRAGRATLVVLGGRVQGALGTGGADRQVELVTAGATTRVLPDGDRPATFEVDVHDDETATFKLFSGKAEITADDRTVVVEPHQALTIVPDAPLGRPEQLPDAPRLSSPANGFVERYGARKPTLDLRWSAVPGADGYSIEIARDREFEDLLLEDELSATWFSHGNLAPGTYYWRVATRRGELVGAPSRVRSFRLIEDRVPPNLIVTLPDATVGTSELTVRGRTDPGARVLIGIDRVTPEESGEFTYALSLRPGPNLIVVEAVDAVGNAAYHSQYVNAKF